MAHPILLVSALVLDFLAIHPVADGNGRLARLLTTHVLLAQGYTVSRYASIEQRMFDTKDAYYDSIYASQRRWHEGEHDIWPWIGYLVDVLAHAYDDFEGRVAARLAVGTKQDQVRTYVMSHAPERFRVRDIRAALALATRRSGSSWVASDGRASATDPQPPMEPPGSGSWTVIPPSPRAVRAARS